MNVTLLLVKLRDFLKKEILFAVKQCISIQNAILLQTFTKGAFSLSCHFYRIQVSSLHISVTESVLNACIDLAEMGTAAYLKLKRMFE